MTDANAAFTAAFNDPATYTPAGSTAVTVTLERLDLDQRRSYDAAGSVDVETLVGLLPQSYAITPAVGDAITYGGKTYIVEAWTNKAPDWQITATRAVPVKRTAGALQQAPNK